MATLPFVQELANLVGEDGSSKFFIDDGNLSAPFTKMLEALDFVFDEGLEVGYHLKRTKGVYGLGCSMSILSRSTCVRILWDKHMHGRNLAKHSLFTDDTTCPLCGGADSQYHIIRECQHPSMRSCRQKHIALLDIRRAHLHRTNNPVYTLFQAHLAFASTLGEEKMSLTGLACWHRLSWTF